MSLQFTNESAKTLFYHRKALLKLGLITKQIHYQKSKVGQNFQGTLFHLPRFYVERKSKPLVLIHSLVTFLRERSNSMASYDEVKQQLGIGGSLKNLAKHSEFQRFIRADSRVPYRMVFPNAKESDWKCKNRSDMGESPLPKEKTVSTLLHRRAIC
jgi:hypothetical protein